MTRVLRAVRPTPRRTSSPTRRRAGARAAATTRSSPPCRASSRSSGSRRRRSSSSPASAAPGRFAYYMDTYGMHGIHGRGPALATGLAAARDDLSIWVVTGDGDALSIGGNHLIHALRRNVPVKILLFNNQIYGLTKGQASPTSRARQGHEVDAVRLDRRAVQPGVAGARRRGDVRRPHGGHATSSTCPAMLRAAAAHEGAALVEIYQNCPVFNDGAFDALRDKKASARSTRSGSSTASRSASAARREHGVARARDRRPADRRPPPTWARTRCWSTTPTATTRRSRSRSRAWRSARTGRRRSASSAPSSARCPASELDPQLAGQPRRRRRRRARRAAARRRHLDRRLSARGSPPDRAGRRGRRDHDDARPRRRAHRAQGGHVPGHGGRPRGRAALRALLAARAPDDAVLGEEGGGDGAPTAAALAAGPDRRHRPLRARRAAVGDADRRRGGRRRRWGWSARPRSARRWWGVRGEASDSASARWTRSRRRVLRLAAVGGGRRGARPRGPARPPCWYPGGYESSSAR